MFIPSIILLGIRKISRPTENSKPPKKIKIILLANLYQYTLQMSGNLISGTDEQVINSMNQGTIKSKFGMGIKEELHCTLLLT